MSKKAPPPSAAQTKAAPAAMPKLVAAKTKAAPAAMPKPWPTPPATKKEVKTEVKTESTPETDEPDVTIRAVDIPIYPMDEDDELEETIPGPSSSMTSSTASRKTTPVRRVSFGKPRNTGRSSSRGRSPDPESGSTSSTASWEQLAGDTPQA
jgi:hypothetical protein